MSNPIISVQAGELLEIVRDWCDDRGETFDANSVLQHIGDVLNGEVYKRTGINADVLVSAACGNATYVANTDDQQLIDRLLTIVDCSNIWDVWPRDGRPRALPF